MKAPAAIQFLFATPRSNSRESAQPESWQASSPRPKAIGDRSSSRPTSWSALTLAFALCLASLPAPAQTSIVAAGYNAYGQCNVPTLPSGSFVEVSGGFSHTMGRTNEGLLLGWGDNSSGQCSPPSLPAGVSYVQVKASNAVTAALRSDGVVVAFGTNAYGQQQVPPFPPGTTCLEIAGQGVF
ncbi:MAG TPA: RCC1 domain-containing protein, partial [Planctomycetota bacterium]|nr:RCC1 domain-containing protein [Planctomycetota bacterium]